MASPTFNGATIFDSTDATGGSFSEGVLWPGEYSKIVQTIHFNGENGNRILTHGWGDRPWIYRGKISASSISALNNIFQGIQSAIDEADEQPSTYHSLVDTFGRSYQNAQVRYFNCLDIRKSEITSPTSNQPYTGYVAEVEVRGIIQGMEQDGA